jgi:hypothetical protein
MVEHDVNVHIVVGHQARYLINGKPAPKNPLRNLTDEERERYAKYGYVKWIAA